MNRIATLEIHNWSMSMGGEHYTGSIRYTDIKGQYQMIEVVHPLTGKEALYLNKKDSWSGHRKGKFSDRFETCGQLIHWAIKIFHKNCNNCPVLNLGSCAVCDPQKILVGPEPFKTLTNKLAAALDACGGYEGDAKQADKIFKEYQKLLKKFKL